MADNEDHIAIAAEYALGTLDADERAQVETMMAVDPEFTAMVHAWEFRLGVLNQMVGSVEPRPELWERVRAAVGHSPLQQAPLSLPEAPPPPVDTPAPPAAPSAQYVALLQGSAGGPAFILTVDGATKNFTVRKVGAPPVEAGKSYELWLISDKLGGRPRSLGVIGANDFTARTVLTGFDSDVINGGVYAVTVEQGGGSPDGAPHATPVFAGKLIETVPAK